MKYYLIYSFLFLYGFSITAQTGDNKKEIGLKLTLLEVGPYFATPLNENFTSNSDYNLGFELNSFITIADRYQVGLGYNHFKIDNHDFTRTGYIGATTNEAFYLMLGYQYLLNDKISAALNYSIGKATYKHELIDSPEDFHDDAFYNNFSIKLNYALNKNFSLRLQAGYRIDFLDVDVPEEIESLYDTATYFNAGLAIGYTFHFSKNQ